MVYDEHKFYPGEIVINIDNLVKYRVIGFNRKSSDIHKVDCWNLEEIISGYRGVFVGSYYSILTIPGFSDSI